MDLSGLVEGDDDHPDIDVSPKSPIGGFARCGPHRAKFIAETVWNIKDLLVSLGSDLVLRAGNHGEVIRGLIKGFKAKGFKVGAVWTTGLVGSEEVDQERGVAAVCGEQKVDFKLWADEKYFIDE